MAVACQGGVAFPDVALEGVISQTGMRMCLMDVVAFLSHLSVHYAASQQIGSEVKALSRHFSVLCVSDSITVFSMCQSHMLTGSCVFQVCYA